MDNLRLYILFNGTAVISGHWEDDIERLCTMESHLWLERFLPAAGLKLHLLYLLFYIMPQCCFFSAPPYREMIIPCSYNHESLKLIICMRASSGNGSLLFIIPYLY